jgi:hypothetical protein
LTSVTIPNSVESIGYSAFKDCSGLTSIEIPNSVESIGYSAFFGCSGLTSVKVEDGNEVYDSRDNCNAIIETATNSLIVGSNSTVIPNSVTSIGDWAFKGCSGLTSVTIPNCVTSIGAYAFVGTAWYKSLPDGAVYLGKVLYAYKGPMPYGASIDIKDGTVSISPYAFEDCSRFTSIEIPNSVESIGDYAFYGCSGLTEVEIPNSVESIGYGTFSGCSGLTSVTIPNSVTSIGNRAFQGCSGLTEVEIPNSVTSIGYFIFEGCYGLTDVYCLASSVPETHSNAFGYSNFGNATLHVPAESVEAFAATAPWSGFGEIVALPAEEVEITIGSTDATTFSSEYALDFAEVEGVKAYAATGYNTRTGVVTLTRVKTAKAGTGLFVVGDEGTYSIPVIESSDDNSLNMLVGVTEEVTIPTADDTYTNYIYGKSDDNTGFFKLTGDKVVPAGKAYLQIPTAWFPAVAESKIKIEFEDGTTTGIEDVEEQVRPNDGVIYDLHGRVVKNPGKGIYIVNGKKVLF